MNIKKSHTAANLNYDTACAPLSDGTPPCAPLSEGGRGEKMPDPRIQCEAGKSGMTGRKNRVLQSFHILPRTGIAQEKRAVHRRPKKYCTDQII